MIMQTLQAFAVSNEKMIKKIKNPVQKYPTLQKMKSFGLSTRNIDRLTKWLNEKSARFYPTLKISDLIQQLYLLVVVQSRYLNVKKNYRVVQNYIDYMEANPDEISGLILLKFWSRIKGKKEIEKRIGFDEKKISGAKFLIDRFKETEKPRLASIKSTIVWGYLERLKSDYDLFAMHGHKFGSNTSALKINIHLKQTVDMLMRHKKNHEGDRAVYNDVAELLLICNLSGKTKKMSAQSISRICRQTVNKFAR